VEGDSLGGRGAFSVGGQRETLNQVTLDGASFASALTGGQAGGGSPLGLPQEGMRGTQVVTSTFDVARGQFAGGLVAMTTRGGTNRTAAPSPGCPRSRFQAEAGSPERAGFRQNRLSGGVGGPIVRDRLFYFGSFSLQRRTDALYALQPRDPLSTGALGVSPDSVARFLDVLSDHHGRQRALRRIHAHRRRGEPAGARGLGRDAAAQRRAARAPGAVRAGQRPHRLPGDDGQRRRGGEQRRRRHRHPHLALGGGWINEFRASVNLDRRDQVPYEEMPEGRVRVSSDLPDGQRGIGVLAFGGERSMPTYSRERTLEVANELSFLFRDLAPPEAGRAAEPAPSSRTPPSTSSAPSSTSRSARSPTARRRASRGAGAAHPRGRRDQRRRVPGRHLAAPAAAPVTYGVRLEGSRFDRAPERNPAVEARFGHRTDFRPADVRLSPRAGFSWRLNEQGAPLRMVRGGVGEFRGRAPFSLFASALDQTGLVDGESLLVCIGDAVPAPDWGRTRAILPPSPRRARVGYPARPPATGGRT
jgi:hypothetical protein